MASKHGCDDCGRDCAGDAHVYQYFQEEDIDMDMKDPIKFQPFLNPVDLLHQTHTYLALAYIVFQYL